MFRANLIGDPQYYRLRWNIPLIIFGSIVGVAFAGGYDRMPGWISISVLCVIGISGFYIYKSSKRFKEIIETESIEMDDRQIRLISHKNHKTSKFDLDQIDQIIVQNEYKMPLETIMDIWNDLTGRHRKNYIIIKDYKGTQRFDFEIQSYYMIQQLEQIIERWATNGYPVQRMDD